MMSIPDSWVAENAHVCRCFDAWCFCTRLPYATLLRRQLDGASAHCCRAVKDVVMALHPNPLLHNIGTGNNLESSELLSERQLRERLNSFIGDAAGMQTSI